MWCVQTPTGAFVARRRGFVFVTGNSGFPKSTDISKAIDKEAGAKREVINGQARRVGFRCANTSRQDKSNFSESIQENEKWQPVTAPATPDAATWAGYGSALKPAWEPVICARKSRAGTYAQTAVEHGSGALWIDGSRIEIIPQRGDGWRPSCYDKDYQYNNKGQFLADIANGKIARQNPAGRWPANLLLDEVSAEMLGEQSGESKSTRHVDHSPHNGPNGYGPDDHDGWCGNWHKRGESHDDTGTAARFFYTAKSSRSERDAGLPDGQRNTNPCVKPIDLIRYLCMLIRSPEPYLDEARLLIPFAGSGSECIGAMLAGWRNITAIENEQEYIEIAQARFGWWQRAYEQTGITDPKELIKAMKGRTVEAQPALPFTDAAR
jgi:hypothetical protein